MKINNLNNNLIEMALLGEFKPKYKVRIYSEGGPIPHFHIDNDQTDEHCCIRIDKAEYFNHENYMTNFLSKKDLKKLVDWLSSSSKAFSILNMNLTVYQNICILWNQNNENWVLESIPNMPDYLNIK